MKARVAVSLGVAVLVVGYMAAGSIRATLPGRPGTQITPPSAYLPPELASFSGIWEGSEDGVLPNRLIVEEIFPTWASIVYHWADSPTGNVKAGRARVLARVLPDGRLRWGYPVRFTLELADDGMSIKGSIERAGAASRFTLKKVEPAATK